MAKENDSDRRIIILGEDKLTPEEEKAVAKTVTAELVRKLEEIPSMTVLAIGLRKPHIQH